jgi:hypothetical protein
MLHDFSRNLFYKELPAIEKEIEKQYDENYNFTKHSNTVRFAVGRLILAVAALILTSLIL